MVAGVGGGGLISGIAAAVKPRHPSVAVVGVESASQPAAYLARKSGHAKPIDLTAYKLDDGTTLKKKTIADGISVSEVGKYTLPFLRDPAWVDEILTVQEGEIAKAIAVVLRKGKMLIEGACATTVAALLNRDNQKLFEGKKVVLVLSGGNLDPARLAEIIHWYEFSEFVKDNHQDPDEAWKKRPAPPA